MNARTAIALYVALALHGLAALVLLLMPDVQSGPGAGRELGLGLKLEGSDSVFAVETRRTTPAPATAAPAPARKARAQARKAPAPKTPAAPLAASPSEVEVAADDGDAAAGSADAPDRTRANAVNAPDAIAAGPGGAGAAASAPPARAGGGGMDGYLARLRAHLYRFRRELPGRIGSARASVGFEVHADGSLGQVHLAQGSGLRELDEEAVALIRRAAPLPRPPQGRAMRLVVPITIEAQ